MTIRDAFGPDFLPPLLAGIALTAACALLSVVIVLKRLAFIGQGITHAGFGGVGMAAFLAATGWWRDLAIFLFCIGTAVVIAVLGRSRKVMIDTAIGILLVAAMGVGFLLDQMRIHLRGEEWYRTLTAGRVAPPTQWDAVLFGNILYLRSEDVWLAVACAALVALTMALLYKEIVFFAFDETVSRVFGVRTGLLHYLLLIMIAAIIVLCMKLLGLILVNALLIIPGAAALLVSRRLSTVLVTSVILGEVGMVGGYLAAFGIWGGRLPVGPIVVVILALLFAAAIVANRLRSART